MKIRQKPRQQKLLRVSPELICCNFFSESSNQIFTPKWVILVFVIKLKLRWNYFVSWWELLNPDGLRSNVSWSTQNQWTPQLVQVVNFTPWFELVKLWVSWSDGNHELFDEVLIAWIDLQRKTLILKQSRQPSFLNQINVVMGKIAVFVQLSEILLGSKKKAD